MIQHCIACHNKDVMNKGKCSDCKVKSCIHCSPAKKEPKWSNLDPMIESLGKIFPNEPKPAKKEPTEREETPLWGQLQGEFSGILIYEERKRLYQFISQQLENQKQKVRDVVENRMLTIKWLWNKEGTDLDKLLMVQVQMNYLLQEIEKI